MTATTTGSTTVELSSGNGGTAWGASDGRQGREGRRIRAHSYPVVVHSGLGDGLPEPELTGSKAVVPDGAE